MSHVAACISMLHEDTPLHSATRLFRGEPVLAWTLRRISRAERVGSMVVMCWEDQLGDVEPIAAEAGADVLAKGPRMPVAALDAISAARRWADGWRGGLLGTCDFDAGFHAPWHREIAQAQEAAALLLVDPSAGLVDPVLIDELIAHADAHPEQEICFTQCPPGLCGTLVRPALLERLSKANLHPGRLLHYMPDQPVRDPMSGEGCMPVATPVVRSLDRFTLHSHRQIERVTAAMTPLNGQLIRSGAEQIAQMMRPIPPIGPLPREIVLEINIQRATRSIFSPATHARIDRTPMSLDMARELFAQAAGNDELRLTLGGVGDPLLADGCFAIIEAASAAGNRAIHLETDLLGVDAGRLERLAASAVDVVSVHLPAYRHQTYAALMGVDTYAQVLENLRLLITARHRLGRGVPIIVPVFTKCRENLAEMEPWYDQWLRALGSAVLRGPSTCGGFVPDVAVADMAPVRRRGCFRINTRMTVLSDGSVVACEEDLLGRHPLGHFGETPLDEIWTRQFGDRRAQHAAGQWDQLPLCRGCTEWHRP